MESSPSGSHTWTCLCSQPEPQRSGAGCMASPTPWAHVSSPARGTARLVYYQEHGQWNELGLKVLDHLPQTVVSLCWLLKGSRNDALRATVKAAYDWGLAGSLVAAEAAGICHCSHRWLRWSCLGGEPSFPPKEQPACRKPGLGAPPRGPPGWGLRAPHPLAAFGKNVCNSQLKGAAWLCPCSSEEKAFPFSITIKFIKL